MAPLPVVERLDIGEDRRSRMLTGWPSGAVQQLLFEGGEETFGRGIIEAGSWLASAGAGTVLSEDTDVRGAQILPAAVRMVNEANAWSSTDQCHLQRVGGQFGAQVIGERPPPASSPHPIQAHRH